MVSVLLNSTWISLSITSLFCFQLVAIRERTFVLKWREGNHEVGALPPAGLTWQKMRTPGKVTVRGSEGRICQNGRTVPSLLWTIVSRQQKPQSPWCFWRPGEHTQVEPCVFLLHDLGQKHQPLKSLSAVRDFLARSDCLLWTKGKNKQHKNKSKRPLTQGARQLNQPTLPQNNSSLTDFLKSCSLGRRVI